MTLRSSRRLSAAALAFAIVAVITLAAHVPLGLGTARGDLGHGRPAAARATAPAHPIALGISPPRAPGTPGTLDRVAREIGRQPSIVMWYQTWGEPLAWPSQLRDVAAHGAVPMITWEPWQAPARPGRPPLTLAAIADGAYDGYLAESARLAAHWGRPLEIRFAQEMNGTWYPWGSAVGDNSPARYVAAWRHVVELFRSHGAGNVRWVWSPNVDSGGQPFAQDYPGDAWVDAVALDGYNQGSIRGRSWRSLFDVFGASYRTITRLTERPLLIAETATAGAGGDKAAWITRGLTQDLPRRLPRVRALIWFDRDKEANWKIDSSHASLTAFRTAVDGPVFAAAATLAGRRSAR